MFAAIAEILQREGNDRAAHAGDLRPRGRGGEGPGGIVVGQGRRAARHRSCPAPTGSCRTSISCSPYLKHEEWWLQNAALHRADPGGRRRALLPEGAPARSANWSADQPARGPHPRLAAGNPRQNQGSRSRRCRQLAAETLKETYTGYAGVKTAPGGQDISSQLRLPPGIHRRLAGRRAGRTGRALRDRPAALPERDPALQGVLPERGPEAVRPQAQEGDHPDHHGRVDPRVRRQEPQQAAQAGRRRSADARRGPAGCQIDGLVALYDRAGQRRVRLAHVRRPQRGRVVVPFLRPDSRRAGALRPTDHALPRGDPAEGHGELVRARLSIPPRPAGRRGKSPFGQYDGKIPRPARFQVLGRLRRPGLLRRHQGEHPVGQGGPAAARNLQDAAAEGGPSLPPARQRRRPRRQRRRIRRLRQRQAADRADPTASAAAVARSRTGPTSPRSSSTTSRAAR